MISAIKNIKRVFSQNGGSGGGSNLEIKDNSSTLTSAATSIDFTGAGVTSSVVGTAVTLSITGGGGGTSSTSNLFAYYNFI
jgi:hypothetical protein